MLHVQPASLAGCAHLPHWFKYFKQNEKICRFSWGIRRMLRKNQLHIILVLGARPQIIKSAPLIHLATKSSGIRFEVIHTGQHYDYEMSKIFFDEFQLPDPVANLGVGSGTHAWQSAQIMIRLEKVLKSRQPDLIMVPGDTNSTLASALTSVKLHIPVAHIEAGARSYDMKMPEEINRRLTDHCSFLLFTPTENCTKNLLKEGINKDNIRQTGDTMYDVLLQQLPKAQKNAILKQLSLVPKTYALLTIHRPENVDNPQNLRNIAAAILQLKNLTVVFPIHPRTRKQLQKVKVYRKFQENSHIKLVEPIGYHETIQLIQNAKVVLTDSGGIQKETFWLHTPCVTLRENTEWIETVRLKANYLTGPDAEKILKMVDRAIKKEKNLRRKLEQLPNLFGDGKASQKILEATLQYYGKRQ
jgi:UDP-N-acetylglucosamine 2-epimerase